MKQIKLTWLLMIALMISACGFHLRGNYDLSKSLAVVSLQGISQHSDTGRLLVSALNASDVTVADEKDTNNFRLVISNESINKRILSLDSTGRANQYELRYQLSFKLQDEQGQDRVAEKTISLRREFLYDENLVLAKSAEEKRLVQDMRSDAVQQLIRRLAYSLKVKATPASAINTPAKTEP